jgi:hypothetical protein
VSQPASFLAGALKTGLSGQQLSIFVFLGKGSLRSLNKNKAVGE